LHYSITWVLICLIIVLPLCRQLFFYFRRHSYQKKEATSRCWFFWEISKGQVSKERIECMSDAAVAIIACVLVLDLTVEHFPKETDVEHHGLTYELEHLATDIGVYVGTYLSVSLLWYVNHTIVHHIKNFDFPLLYLQKIFLAFLSMTPFNSNLLVKLGNQHNSEGSLANLVAFGFYLGACIANTLMLLWCYYKKEKVVYGWAVNRGFCGQSKKGQLYVLLKTILLPILTFIGLLGSLGPGNVTYYFRFVIYGLIILSMFVLKLTLACHVGKGTKFQEVQAVVMKEENELRKENAFDMSDDKSVPSNNATVLANDGPSVNVTTNSSQANEGADNTAL